MLRESRVSPTTASAATAKVEAPHPVGNNSSDLPDDTVVKKLTSGGTCYLDKVQDKVSLGHGFEEVLVITDGDTIIVTDLYGEMLVEHT